MKKHPESRLPGPLLVFPYGGAKVGESGGKLLSWGKLFCSSRPSADGSRQASIFSAQTFVCKLFRVNEPLQIADRPTANC